METLTGTTSPVLGEAGGGAAMMPGTGPGAAMQQEGAAAEAPVFPFFEPSFDLPLAGAVVGLVLVAVHLGLVIRTRAAFFGPVMVTAALMFAAGMSTRLIVVLAPSLKPVFAISSVVLMVTGSTLATALAFTYTRLVWWITPAELRTLSNLWLPPRATSFTLVLSAAVGDIISTLGGGQIITPPPFKLAATGAVLKMLVWMFSCVLAARFTAMSRRWRMDAETRWGSLELGLALTASTFLLSILGIMNILEKDALETLIATRKPGSVLTTSEWPAWTFQFTPMLLIIIIMAAYHPGYYLPRRLMRLRFKGKELESMDAMRDHDDDLEALTPKIWAISKPVPAASEKEMGGPARRNSPGSLY